MKLTEHFTLEELTASDTARRLGIVNSFTANDVNALQALCDSVLEPARKEFGKPIIVRSGFRCERLNKEVGGKVNSQHLKGEAADLQVSPISGLRRLFDILRKRPIDQLLFERKNGKVWIHVSHKLNGMQRGMINDNYYA
jgi:hypothetical protein